MVLLLLTASLAATLFWGIWRGRPVALTEPAIASLPCLSYAPFRRPGHTPFDADLHIAPAQIEADLRLLRPLTSCVRTYGLDHGLDAVPEVARHLGLRVILGIWIGNNVQDNDRQLNGGLRLARKYRDVVDWLVVGNEVLLRGDLPPDELAELLARARHESPVPVSYADVWEFWLRHADTLASHVDIVAAHILPYWEDEPVANDDAISYVYAIAEKMRLAFPTKPVYVAETGWPAAGRQRGPAVPGHLQQARFVRELLARQSTQPLPFNLIEAFDQPWKRNLEGAMGGAWGIFDSSGNQRVGFSGPVIPEPEWLGLPVSATGAAGLLLMLAWRRFSNTALVALACGSALTGAFAWLQIEMLPQWSRTTWEWISGGGAIATSMFFGLLASLRLALVLQTGRAGNRGSIVNIFAAEKRGAALWFAVAHALLMIFATVDALGLAFDARYRPLPWVMLAVPAVMLALLACLGDRLSATAHAERLLAAICTAGAMWIGWNEGLANTQAMLYVAALVTFATATLWPCQSALRKPTT